jgi:hypothetical protein
MYFPYIGITDFMTFEQVKQMLAMFNFYLASGSQRKLHVGVMMSYKTLHGISSKWTKAFPSKGEIATIFSSVETYNCLHYADYENHPGLHQDLSQAVSYGGANIHAVQLDMVWPEPASISAGIKGCGKAMEVILQLGKQALAEANNDPYFVAQKLEKYNGVIDRVLLDRSMGRGLSLDAQGLLPFIEAIKSRHPHLGLVVAGGLGPDTVGLVAPLADRFPDLSIDAQGKLRPSGSALDPVNWDFAASYLREALKLLK